MKKIFKILPLIVLLTLLMVTPVLALQEEPPVSPGIDEVSVIFAALVGWPSLLMALTNLLKMVGFLPDGSAPKFTYWANLVAFVGTAVFVFTGQLDLLASVDQGFSTLAVIVGNVIVLFGSLFPASLAVNKMVYQEVRGYPVIGYSNSQALGKKSSVKK